MTDISIDVLPALVAATAAFVLGGLWYGPLFGRAWARAVDVDPDVIHPVVYAVGFLCYLLLAGSLSVLAHWAGVGSALQGMVLGGVAWLGIALALGVNTALFSGRSRTVIWIDGLFQLVAFLLVGGILGAWA